MFSKRDSRSNKNIKLISRAYEMVVKDSQISKLPTKGQLPIIMLFTCLYSM